MRWSIQQEQQLGVNLFLRRHGRQRFDLLDRNHAAFDHTGLKRELRVILGVLRQSFCQRHWIAFRVSDRGHAGEALQHFLDFGALGSAFRQRILDDAILRSRTAQRFAKLIILSDRQLAVGSDNHAGNLLQLRSQLLNLFCLFCSRDCHYLEPLFVWERGFAPFGRVKDPPPHSYAFAAVSIAVVSIDMPGPMLELK